MNLTSIYPHTNMRLYKFIPTSEVSRSESFIIEIHKWSEVNNKHMFEEILNQKAYTEMNAEPEMVFDDLLNSIEGGTKKQKETKLSNVLDKNRIHYEIREMRTSYNGNRNYVEAVVLSSEEEANKCVKLMTNMFKYATPY